MSRLIDKPPSRRCWLRPLTGLMAALLMTGSACQLKSKSRAKDYQPVPLEVVGGSFIAELNTHPDPEQEPPAPEAFKESLDRQLQDIAGRFNCKEARMESIAWADGDGVAEAGLAGTIHLQFDGCPATSPEETTARVEEMLQALSTVPEISMVEAEAVMRTRGGRDNDPGRERQYYLDHIKRDDACNRLPGSSKPVVIAVVDSGVERQHSDLQQQFYRDGDGRIIGANFVGKGARGAPDDRWDDTNGHGTHVAGIAAAAAGNGVGITGTGSCAQVRIMPVRVMGANGTGSSLEIDRGIQWAAANGAHIINLSLGSNAVSRQAGPGQTKNLYEVLARRGVMVFAAAGNDGFENGRPQGGGYLYSFPASYARVIAVAATDKGGSLAGFSVRGKGIDMAAPGTAILSTWPGNGYKSLDGTSMATPVAAGAWALAVASVNERVTRPLDHDKAMELLNGAVRTEAPLDKGAVASGGVLDLDRLLNRLAAAFPAEEEAAPSPDGLPAPAPSPSPAPAPAPETPPEPAPAPEEEAPRPDEEGGDAPAPVVEEPATPDPVEPAPPADEPMGFVGLEPGQRLRGSVTIAVANWPRDTYRVYLYWGKNGRQLSSFTSLGRANLSADRTTVSTDRQYYLYGQGELHAEAVDYRGQRLELISVPLTGPSGFSFFF